jgi:ribosome maturation factor RimP
LRDRLTVLLAPVVNDLELELWELEYHTQKGGGLLRLYIDRAEGVTIEDCERVSRAVSAVLDADDPIPGQYTLEVSSPGLDRVLRTREHFARFVGELARVETIAPLDGRKRFNGRLSKVNTDEIALEVDGRTVTIPLAAIHKARLQATI